VIPRRSRSNLYIRAIMLAAAVILPAASLIGLGSLWLWQNGYLIVWAVSASGFVLVVYGFAWLALRGLLRDAPDAAAVEAIAAADWDQRELAAWEDILALAATVKSQDLGSRDEALALGLRTIELVAHRLHPGDQAPLLKFSVPEALAVVERVSGQLGPFVADNIPLGDRLTVRQMMAIYRWRTAAGVAVKAYDLWRMIRLLNPAAALANEVRERIAGQLMEHGREELAKRLARAYVETVGRAAIDLYGGRLMPRDSGPVSESVLKPDPPIGEAGDAPKPRLLKKGSRLWSQVKNATGLLKSGRKAPVKR
jgi:uncharacterized protein